MYGKSPRGRPGQAEQDLSGILQAARNMMSFGGSREEGKSGHLEGRLLEKLPFNIFWAILSII